MARFKFNGDRKAGNSTSSLRVTDINGVDIFVRRGESVDLAQATRDALNVQFVLDPDDGSAIPAKPFASQTANAAAAASVATVAVSQGRAINTLEVSGNSYGDGAGPVRHARMTSVAAKLLGAAEHNLAKDGAIMYRGESGNPGGWASFLNRKKPLKGDGTRRTAAPYLPAADACVMVRGVNDLGQLGKGNLEPLRQALITEISRYRAGAVFDADHASVVYGGTWNAMSSYNGNSDGKYRLTAGADATVTITVPADFPGGTIVIGSVVGGSNAISGRWDIAVDGGAKKLWDLSAIAPAYTSFYGGPCYRLTGLAAGAHTIVLTVGAITPGAAGIAFNYWQIEAPSPPPIVMVGQPHLPPAGATGNVDNAGVDDLNAVLLGVANSFDRVKLLNSNLLIGGDPTKFATDNLHPNEWGHAILGSALAKLIQIAISELPESHPRSVSTPLWHKVGDVGARAAFTNNWVSPAAAGGYVELGFRKDRAGITHLRGLARAGAVGTSIFTLPEPHRSDYNIIRPITALDSGGVRSITYVYIEATTGNVIPIPPMPSLSAASTWIDLSGVSFPAMSA